MNERQALLERALGHHQAGRLGQAQALYREILAQEPGQPDAQHFLGLLGCQLGQYDAGLALMEQSLAARREPAYLNNLGNMLREHGRLEEAIARYQEAVRLQVDYAEAHNNLGNALREAGRAQEAMYCCARAIELSPQSAQAYNNLGNALQDLGELDAAAVSYGKAIALAPGYAQAYSNLGNVQRARQQMDAAIGSYRQAIGLQPDLHVAHHGLGLALRATGDLAGAAASLRASLKLNTADVINSYATVLRDQGELDEAASYYRKAIALSPDDAQAYSNLSGVLRRQQQFAEALSMSDRAVALSPEQAQAWNALGNAQHSLDDLPGATRSYRRALELDNDDAGAHHNLALVLLKQERTDEALVHCRRALALEGPNASMLVNLGDTLRAQGDIDSALDAYRDALTLDPAEPLLVYQRLLFCAAGTHTVTPERFIDDARRCGALMAATARPYRHLPTERTRTGALRVGLVSGDLRQHPSGIFLENVLDHIDARRIELIAYSTCAKHDEVTDRLKHKFGLWRDVHDLGPEALARRIHDDAVDVLVDLSGHTQFSGLSAFAWKPAPVQVSWLGFFATTGLSQIDYFLGDRHVLPETEEAHFVERPWRLPDSYLCFTPPRESVSVGPLPMLSNGHVTFGCFGKLIKIGDNVVELWSRMLHALPDSRLFLKALGLEHPGAREATKARFAAHGIDEGRLILEGPSPRALYLDAYNRVDITLSPFPYGGGTTTAEGLWMGVPVLGMKGDRFVTHICESLLHTAGLGEWIAEDEEDYVRKALAYAGDPGKLNTLRAGLRAQVLNSPLCDAKRFARSLESAFEQMWSRYVAGADKTLEES
ncbi:tetratricopeptide repeat protein [Paraburkholderia phymatum]|uniref:tetratricopeptide repeat protein n=1 Tax=Paraburkholderia phymatum TaxID=148447 RepID=UPI0031717C1D